MKIRVKNNHIEAQAGTSIVSACVVFVVKSGKIVPVVVFSGSGDPKTMRRMRLKIISLLAPIEARVGKRDIPVRNDAHEPGWIKKPIKPKVI